MRDDSLISAYSDALNRLFALESDHAGAIGAPRKARVSPLAPRVMHTPLRIGTRGSQLALWQARAVATRLEPHGVDAELVLIKTSGDRLQSAPMSEVGGKRLFVKEIEDALLAGDVDVAVHSAKDMPALLPDGLDHRGGAAARGSARRVRAAGRRASGRRRGGA